MQSAARQTRHAAAPPLLHKPQQAPTNRRDVASADLPLSVQSKAGALGVCSADRQKTQLWLAEPPSCALWIDDGTTPKYFRNTRLKCDELEKPQENATSVMVFPPQRLELLPTMLQPRPPDVVADGRAAFAEQHVEIALGAAERGGNLIDAEIGIAQMLADEGLGADVHRLGARPG